MGVRRPLRQALTYIRHADRPRVVWADSLCINQDDLEEKSAQVMRMGSIYSQAHVISWLGSGDSRTDYSQCLDFMRRLAAIRGYLSRRANDPEHCGQQDVQWSDPRFFGDAIRLYRNDPTPGVHGIVDGPWKLIEKIFSTPYFARMWVYQEMQSGRSHVFRLGLLHFDRIILEESGRFIVHSGLGQTPEMDTRAISRIATEWGNVISMTLSIGDKILDMPTLVRRCMHLKCMDPRDHIYGVTALCNTGKHFPVDYSLSVQQVFVNFTEYAIRESCELDQHSRPHASAFRSPESAAQIYNWQWQSHLPSWCPDYAMAGAERSRRIDPRLITEPSITSALEDFAELSELRVIAWPSSDDRLVVRGFLHSRIQSCSGNGDDTTTTTLVQRLADATHILQRQQCSEGLDVAFLDVLIEGGLKLDPGPYPDLRWHYGYYGYLPMLRRFGPSFLRRCIPEAAGFCVAGVDDTVAGSAESEFFNKSVCEFLVTRKNTMRGFVSQESTAVYCLGCGPDSVREGDCIFYLHGAKTPIVLRSVNDEGHFMWIGRCYLHDPDFEIKHPWADLEEETVTLV
jgi:hypothetical protein